MNDRSLLRIVFGLTGAVLLLVILLKLNVQQSTEVPESLKVLPAFNAFLNGTCSVLLIVSLIMIRKKNIKAHKALNLTAFMLSTVFLLSYVTFHFFVPDTAYPKDAPMRGFYLFILLTHIVLAAVALPLVLYSFYRGLKGQTERHKKISRWTYPIWLYVTITGVVVYFMISPYYNF